MEREGIYELWLSVRSNKNFDVSMHIEMVSPYGYMSAAIWPLLPVSISLIFYVFFFVVYLIDFSNNNDFYTDFFNLFVENKNRYVLLVSCMLKYFHKILNI